ASRDQHSDCNSAGFTCSHLAIERKKQAHVYKEKGCSRFIGSTDLIDTHLIKNIEDQFSITFQMDAFRRSVEVYREARLLLVDLGQIVADGGLRFADYSKIVLDFYTAPVDRTVESMRDIKEKHHLDRGQTAGDKNVLLSGIIPPASPVCDLIEDAGLTVAGNDIAAMHRSNQYMPSLVEDPGSYYVDFYSGHFPCPTLLHTADRRVDALAKLIEETKAEGVIFIGEKFCEYEFFELPYIEKYLKQRGIKTLVLESYAQDRATVASIKNRVDSFSELLYKT
nr:2-hydroxyacyl-CoA dehydratase family protein [Candidatus Sigynarchaeota archaeon]